MCVRVCVHAWCVDDVLSTRCINGHFNGYVGQEPLTPGMSGVSLASSPFDRLDLGYGMRPALCCHEGKET